MEATKYFDVKLYTSWYFNHVLNILGWIIDLWATYKTAFHWYTKQSLVILLKISKRYLIISVLCIHTPKNYLNGFLLRDFQNQRLSAISNGFHFPYTLQISLQKMLKDLSFFYRLYDSKGSFYKIFEGEFVVSSYTIVCFFLRIYSKKVLSSSFQ